MAAAFDQALQPYASTLPPQISQHSVFVLPKPSFVALAAGKSTDKGSSVASSQDGVCQQMLLDQEDDPDYDFLQAQLSPDIHKKKGKKVTTRSDDLMTDCRARVDSEFFQNMVKNSIVQASQILQEISQPASQFRVIEGEDEL